jgi:hypothetical protein
MALLYGMSALHAAAGGLYFGKRQCPDRAHFNACAAGYAILFKSYGFPLEFKGSLRAYLAAAAAADAGLSINLNGHAQPLSSYHVWPMLRH